MNDRRCLTFEHGPNPEVLAIYADVIGMREIIDRLNELQKVGNTIVMRRWRTSQRDGLELTAERQGRGTVIHDVLITVRRDAGSTNEGALSFELASSADQVQIHCDSAGLERLIQLLTRLSKTRQPIDHDHWMTENWAGHELTERKMGADTTLLHQVDVRFCR